MKLARAMVLVALSASLSFAQVPPEIAAKLRAIGRVVDPEGTGVIYRPLHPAAPYKDVALSRNVSFGPDEKNVVDVFAPEKSGAATRPVLLFVPGGQGDKLGPAPNRDAFYDNVGLWAVKSGMAAFTLQRRPGAAWDDPAKDIAAAIQWIQKNASRYQGNASRMFLWVHSAGNGPVGTYLGHPEFWGPGGVGLKGVVLMSGANMFLPEMQPPAPARNPGPAPAVNGRPQNTGIVPPGVGNNPPAAPPVVDAATRLQRSNLPGLLKLKIPVFLAAAELDPPATAPFNEAVKETLCKYGATCPTAMVFKDQSHMSLTYSANTDDTSVTGPILAWMKGIK
jgi:triacylglycerol lipase